MICVDPRFHVERLDPDLAGMVPGSVDVIPVGALPATLTRPFGIAGDIGLRGLGHIRAAVSREMRRNRPDVVLITGSPYYPMLLARWIRTRWKTPVVLDFQDPWVSSEGARQRFGTKAWLSHRLAVMLEPLAIRHATFITSVSEKQNDEMADRYPWLDRSRMAGIPIGGDPMDFGGTTLEPGTRQDEGGHRGRVVYTGTIWPAAIPVLQKVLLGLEEAMASLPKNLDIEALFMGTTANPNAKNEFRVRPLANGHSISNRIMEIPERRPYLEAVRAMASADVNLIIGSLEPHYTASKIYPILMANRPFLSILHRASSAHAILSNAGGGIALGFETPEELEELPPKIAKALATILKEPKSVGKVDPTAYADYTADAVSGRFAMIFERLRDEQLNCDLRTSAA